MKFRQIKFNEPRRALAQQGLPKGGAVGFELIIRKSLVSASSAKQANYQRALEGESSRTIETIGPVKGARVHLAMPKPLYLSVNKNPLLHL
ncbi:hypothetical protein ACNKHW_12185 [Shigella flexneri]